MIICISEYKSVWSSISCRVSFDIIQLLFQVTWQMMIEFHKFQKRLYIIDFLNRLYFKNEIGITEKWIVVLWSPSPPRTFRGAFLWTVATNFQQGYVCVTFVWYICSFKRLKKNQDSHSRIEILSLSCMYSEARRNEGNREWNEKFPTGLWSVMKLMLTFTLKLSCALSVHSSDGCWCKMISNGTLVF